MSAAVTAMNFQVPQIEEYQRLVPVARQLYAHTAGLAQMMLLPIFLLSILMAYSRDLGIAGAAVVKIRRLFVTAFLLLLFPHVSSAVQTLGYEIALSIDNLIGIDQLIEAASRKAKEHTFSYNLLLGPANDILVAGLVLVSYVILYVARFLILALQHFYWLLLVSLAPLLILLNMFEATSSITRNLFRQLVQVACWPIIWAVLSAFLKALPYASAYATPGGYTTLVTMNFIIAVALLFTPFVTSQLCEGAVTGVGEPAKRLGAQAMRFVIPKLPAVAAATGSYFKKGASPKGQGGVT